MPDDKGIPTTFEMDGLFTEKDIQERHKCYYQCRKCTKWTLQNILDEIKQPCHACGVNDFDITSGTSLRSFNPLIKRKPK